MSAVVLDAIPLDTGHRTRGLGRYVQGFEALHLAEEGWGFLRDADRRRAAEPILGAAAGQVQAVYQAALTG